MIIFIDLILLNPVLANLLNEYAPTKDDPSLKSFKISLSKDKLDVRLIEFTSQTTATQYKLINGQISTEPQNQKYLF